MPSPGNLTRQLAALADALGPVLAPVDQRAQLVDLCSLVRLATGAASVSIARVVGDELVYDAAEGRAAEQVTGMRLSSGRGIAGYVAWTGQSLVVDEVRADPRFARDVAERVGYVPDSLLVVPVVDADDVVLGVISVLDRTSGTGDPLAVVSAAGRVAAPLMATAAQLARLGPMLVRALADSVTHDEPTLAAGLRRVAAELPETDEATAELAALLADAQHLPPAAQRAVGRVLRETLVLATPRRRW
jgi:GAF domain-containing protein